MKSSVRCLIGVLAFLGWMSIADAQQSGGDSEPIKITDKRLPVLEAVRLTLENDPNIKLQKEETVYKEGELQSQSGKFDTHLLLNAQGSFTQTELDAKTIESERDKRYDTRKSLTDESISWRVERTKDSYLDYLSKPSPNSNVSIHDFTPPHDYLFPNNNPIPLTETDKKSLEEFKKTADSDYKSNVIPIADQRKQIQTDIKNIEAAIVRDDRELRKLGDLPKTKQETNSSLGISGQKMLRNGIILSPGLNITEKGSWQYRHKEQTESPLYNSEFKFDIQIPLGRGKGVESAAAGETSAKINYEASLLTLRRTVSNSIYSVLAAYWDLAAAQEKLELYKKSAQSQKELLNLSQSLADADELPKSEIIRIKAREVNARAMVSDAQKTLQQARVNMARIIGLKVEVMDNAPLAADAFPKSLASSAFTSLDTSAFVNYAISQRQDYQAALKAQESAKVLARAAEIDLAPQADAGFAVSYSGLDMNANPAKGLEGVLLKDYTGPSFSARFNMNWAIANNAAKGNLVKARATLNKSQISADDLKRVIAADVVKVLESMKNTANQMVKNTESADLYKETMKNEIEKYRAGTSTLIDTILTEDQLTNSLQDIITVKAQYAKYLAELRFQTESLFTYDDAGHKVNAGDLVTIPSVGGGQRN